MADVFELKQYAPNKVTITDPSVDARKRDRENGRKQAQEHAPEMVELLVRIARNDAEDTKARIAAAKYVCDRAWGTPKAEQTEDPAIANATILDMFASISRGCFSEELAAKQIDKKDSTFEASLIDSKSIHLAGEGGEKIRDDLDDAEDATLL